MGLGIIEVAATVVLAVAAVAAYLWPRRAVNGPEEDTAPTIEKDSISPVAGHAGWVSIYVTAINREACGWALESARVINPIGAKLTLESSVPRPPHNAWDVADPVPDAEFLATLSNTVAINYPLAHAGRRTNPMIRGENDRELVVLWLHLPRSEDEFRIEFIFRSNDTSQRVKSRELSNSTAPNSSSTSH